MSGAGEAAGGGDAPSVTLLGSIDAAEPVWRELETSTACTPFERYDWLRTWVDFAGDEVTPWPVLLEWPDGSRLLLPLAVTRRSSVRVLGWLGDRVSDYNLPLGSTSCRVDGARDRLLAELPPVDVVHLRGQPASMDGRPSPLGSLLGRPSGVALASDLSGGWPAARDTHLSTARRKRLRRLRRRLAEHGELRFQRIEDPQQIEQLVWASARLKRARYPRSPGLARNRVRFYAAAATRMGPTGGVLMFSLRCGGRLVAVEWGLQYQGRFVGFLDGFDERWARYSPGQLLMIDVAEWCSRAGLHTYDLSIGDEDFKRPWSDECTVIHEYLEPLTVRGRAYVLAQRGSSRLHVRPWLRRASQASRDLRAMLRQGR